MRIYEFLNRRHLKIMALLTMTIDHIAVGFITILFKFSTNIAYMRVIGRMAFPLFCYQYVESIYRTHDLKKMCQRLLLLALISEIPYNLLINNQMIAPGMNVIWQFFIHSLLVLIKDWFGSKLSNYESNQFYQFVSNSLMFIVSITVANILSFDYGLFGSSLIMLLYLLRHSKSSQVSMMAIMIGVYYLYDIRFLISGLISVLFIFMYNRDKRIKFNTFESTLYQLYYPVHQLIIWLIISARIF